MATSPVLIRRISILVLCAAAVTGGSIRALGDPPPEKPIPSIGLSSSRASEIEISRSRGLTWLRAAQAESGSWGVRSSDPVLDQTGFETAIAVIALMGSGAPLADRAVHRGLQMLLAEVAPNSTLSSSAQILADVAAIGGASESSIPSYSQLAEHLRSRCQYLRSVQSTGNVTPPLPHGVALGGNALKYIRKTETLGGWGHPGPISEDLDGGSRFVYASAYLTGIAMFALASAGEVDGSIANECLLRAVDRLTVWQDDDSEIRSNGESERRSIPASAGESAVARERGFQLAPPENDKFSRATSAAAIGAMAAAMALERRAAVGAAPNGVTRSAIRDAVAWIKVRYQKESDASRRSRIESGSFLEYAVLISTLASIAPADGVDGSAWRARLMARLVATQNRDGSWGEWGTTATSYALIATDHVSLNAAHIRYALPALTRGVLTPSK